MPLFSPIPRGKSNQGQLQEVKCPRCKTVLQGDEHFTTGKGVGIRMVTGNYSCPCGYSVQVIEQYPIMNRPID